MKRNNHERVLVVGTTPDYIDHIRKKMPKRAVFITDPDVRPPCGPAFVPAVDELVCPLREEAEVMEKLSAFLLHQKISLSGVTCFDCESLSMAAVVARNWALPFASKEAVRHCRNKYISKKLWKKFGVPCPRICEVNQLDDILIFMKETAAGIILKPLSGSGSELIFHCHTAAEAEKAYAVILAGLQSRSLTRMYRCDDQEHPLTILCEEFIDGQEYSCDILLEGEEARILRIAKKYFPDSGPVGTTQAYEIPVRIPMIINTSVFMGYLSAAAKAVGLNSGLCMLDFIVRNGRPYFIEISPRPGGDCLPPLIEKSCGLDMIGVAIDYAEGRWIRIPPMEHWEHLVGVRFHAEKPGRLQAIRPQLNGVEDRIRSMVWLRQPGDQIKLPPEDYTSWLLGYAVFKPENARPIADQVRRLIRRVHVDIAS